MRSPSRGIAGIQGAKRTPDLVPLAHPIALHGVTVDLSVEDDSVRIVATARTADRTGVEMEALTAVAVAGLALIDMVKAVDPGRRHHRRPGRGEDRRLQRHLDPPNLTSPRPECGPRTYSFARFALLLGGSRPALLLVGAAACSLREQSKAPGEERPRACEWPTCVPRGGAPAAMH